jgi:hypothetical protein
MTITTNRLASPTSRLQIVTQGATRRRLDRSLVGLVGLAVFVAGIGAVLPAVSLAVLAGIQTGSGEVAAGVARLALPFLAISAPVTAIWLMGAIGTGRATGRLGGLNDGDRAAIAELHRLLARE